MAFVSIRNGLFLLTNFSSIDPETELEMELSSHLHLFGVFGWLILFSPCYWQKISWRAVRCRMQKKYFFYEALAWALNDMVMRTCVPARYKPAPASS